MVKRDLVLSMTKILMLTKGGRYTRRNEVGMQLVWLGDNPA